MEPAHDAVLEFVKKARPALIAKARALTNYDGKKEKNTFFIKSVTYRYGQLADRLATL
jgi:hypothetical protein